jgi:RNA polymerase sigma-70 factor (sigma-E family)
MEVDVSDSAASGQLPAGHGRATAQEQPRDAETAVTALYRVHAVGLIRLAMVMLGDRAAAEDAVQDAFFGLYRRYASLKQQDRALQYLRSSVLNGCRSQLRARQRDTRRAARVVPAAVLPADHDLLIGEEHMAVLAALRQLPDRQREALVLRFYLELSPADVASAMGIGEGTVKSTTSRALAALAKLLQEET